jgi:hypothetical protein
MHDRLEFQLFAAVSDRLFKVGYSLHHHIQLRIAGFSMRKGRQGFARRRMQLLLELSQSGGFCEIGWHRLDPSGFGFMDKRVSIDATSQKVFLTG